jgi:hypothetical protein
MDTLQNTPFVCFSSQSIIEVHQQLESKPFTSETHSTKFAQEWIKPLFNHHVVVSSYLNGGGGSAADHPSSIDQHIPGAGVKSFCPWWTSK